VKDYKLKHEEIKEEASDSELFKHALSEYEKLADQSSGFKVFKISQESSKHEVSKSVVIDDFMKKKIKQKKYDKSINYSKAKHSQVSIHQKVNLDLLYVRVTKIRDHRRKQRMR
jgi:hypothetical protein